tara:strand:- start:336 stop:515 length:180 start_codon:yes stop_codon:yes gene_type:complete
VKTKISLKDAYHYLIFNIQINKSMAEEIILDERLITTQVEGKVMVDKDVLNKLIKEYNE